MEERKKLETFTTPKATTRWVTLNKPDTNFKKEGKYRVTIALPEGSDEAQALVKKFTDAYNASVAEAKARLAADPKKKLELKNMVLADLPFKQEMNKETCEPTGFLVFNFSATASGVRKKDNTAWHFKPPVYDAKGKPLSDSVMIYGGSVVKVAYQMSPFYATKTGAGISLRLQGVQVIELKSGNSRDAAAYGFGVEDGFDSSDSEEGDTTSQPDNSTPSNVKSGGDF